MTPREPAVLGERCVHALSEIANCQDCVRACPREAWRLDDDSLRLDLALCDGCGLCAAACPEGAIQNAHDPAACDVEGELSIVLACERSGLPDGIGVIPCVHALGLRDLLRLYQIGAHRLNLVRGDCANCARGHGPSLDQAVEELNVALEERSMDTIDLREMWATESQEAFAGARRSDGHAPVNRRGLLRSALGKLIGAGLEFANLSAAEEGPVETPEARLLRAGRGYSFPYVPSITTVKCTGCDACARLCPHRAIALEGEGDSLSYSLHPERCTGCGLCADVCQDGAASVARWAAQTQLRVALVSATCRACGAPFHQPEGSPPKEGLCRICAGTDHAHNLFQVLDCRSANE